ncbi:hypothetical protein L7F22_028191 [Adiantum nelumboides]|nr:hypothetical protein [Adiantum nelumboides]
MDVKGGKYAVRVEGITIHRESMKLKKLIKLYISTTTQYTRLGRSVYKRVREGFRRHIKYGNVTAGVVPVAAVQPFDTFINMTSWRVPDKHIGQVKFLLNGDVEWPVSTDTLVYPKKDMLCLAVVDACHRKPSVLGNFNQQDRLVHIDLIQELTKKDLFLKG